MELSRRQFGRVVAGIYAVGGLFLLSDYLGGPGGAGAHLPLAWHVFPISLLASLGAAIAGLTAPLDPIWLVRHEIVVASLLVALILCTLAVMRIISGRVRFRENSDGDGKEAIDRGNI